MTKRYPFGFVNLECTRIHNLSHVQGTRDVEVLMEMKPYQAEQAIVNLIQMLGEDHVRAYLSGDFPWIQAPEEEVA